MSFVLQSLGGYSGGSGYSIVPGGTQGYGSRTDDSSSYGISGGAGNLQSTGWGIADRSPSRSPVMGSGRGRLDIQGKIYTTCA